jgi:hypothetical protein
MEGPGSVFRLSRKGQYVIGYMRCEIQIGSINHRLYLLVERQNVSVFGNVFVYGFPARCGGKRMKQKESRAGKP